MIVEPSKLKYKPVHAIDSRVSHIRKNVCYASGALETMSSVGVTASTKQLSLSNFILQGLPDFLHFLTPERRILYASPSCKRITGFEPAELHGRFIGAFIHPDDHDTFVSALDEALSFSTSNRLIYRFRKADGQWTALESVCHARINSDQNQIPLSRALNGRQGLHIMARPYFSEYTTLFDSFLEVRIEHKRLSERVAELRLGENNAQALEAAESVPTTSHYEIIEDSKCKSEGNSTGHSRGSLGIPISRRTGSMEEVASAAISNKRRKKRTRTPEPPVCASCGTVASAEWRKGPDGPKTLCNACGLRWAKHMRKTTSGNNAPSSKA